MADDLIGISGIEDRGCDPALADGGEILEKSCLTHARSDAAQPFLERSTDCKGDRLARLLHQHARQSLRFRVFDVQGHRTLQGTYSSTQYSPTGPTAVIAIKTGNRR